MLVIFFLLMDFFLCVNLCYISLGSCCCRWAQFRQMLDEIVEKVDVLMKDKETVSYCGHVGGGHYVSLTTGFRCVDFRKFYLPFGQSEMKPSSKGIALRLGEWSTMTKIVSAINKDYPALANAVPCYLQDDHNNQQSVVDCRECNPFSL